MTAAKVLGIIGGVIGMILGSFLIAIGVYDLISPNEYDYFGISLTGILIWGFLVFLFGIIGLVGGMLTKRKPVVAGVLMLVAGICGFIIYIFLFWIVPGLLLIVGGALALASKRKQAPRAVTPTEEAPKQKE